MAQATAQKFQRHFGEYQHKARREPVDITRHGRRELVLLSAERYDWMMAAMKRSFRTEEAPEFVLEAVKRARMHARHSHLNKLLKK